MSKLYDLTYFVSMIGTGEVFSWGSNENGQCGTGGNPY